MSKFCTKSSLGLNDYSQASISLSDDQCVEIKSICRRRKVDALSWKRARAIDLLDAGVDPETIWCLPEYPPPIFIISIPRFLTEWRTCTFSAEFALLASEGLRASSDRPFRCSVSRHVMGKALPVHRTLAAQDQDARFAAYRLRRCRSSLLTQHRRGCTFSQAC